MNEQIIQMAIDFGGFFPAVYHPSSPEPRMSISAEQLEHFAAAIRAATKEEDAKICEDEEDAHMVFDNWQAAKALDVAAERIRASK